MRIDRPSLLVALLLPLAASAQDSYKVEPLKEAPPAAVAPAIKETLRAEGFRVVDGQGNAFADVWLRKAIPASAKPAGSKGAVLFPNLAEGELIGVLRFAAEGHDYRDQAIPAGVYTLRYGLQPVNGDHLGVSPFRDYTLLVPAAKDKDAAPLAKKMLETRSADSAGSNHPGVLLLQAAPEGSKGAAMARDEAKNLWGVVLPASVSVKGESGEVPMPLQIVVVGAAAL